MKETFCCSLFVRKSNVALSFPLYLIRIVRRENEELQLSLSLSLLDGKKQLQQFDALIKEMHFAHTLFSVL